MAKRKAVVEPAIVEIETALVVDIAALEAALQEAQSLPEVLAIVYAQQPAVRAELNAAIGKAKSRILGVEA